MSTASQNVEMSVFHVGIHILSHIFVFKKMAVKMNFCNHDKLQTSKLPLLALPAS